MSEDIIVAVSLTLIVGGILVAIAISEYKKRHRDCKECGGKNTMKMTSVEEVPKGGNNRIFFCTEKWTCGKCGYQDEVKKTVNYGTRAASTMSDKLRKRKYGEIID